MRDRTHPSWGRTDTHTLPVKVQEPVGGSMRVLGSIRATTWKGRYRVDGTTVWRDVNGTATTSTTSAPFTVEERRSRLVDDLCTDIPQPDDC